MNCIIATRRKSFFLFSPLFMFFFLSFISIDAYSQSYMSFKYEREQIINTTRFQIGALRFFPTIQLRNIGREYNVYYVQEKENPLSDYTATLSFQLKTYFLFHDYLILSLTANPEYVYYFEVEKERRWNKTIFPEFKLLLFDRFVVSGNYLHSNRRYRVWGEFDVKANEKVESYASSIFYETARMTSLGFSGSIIKIHYDDITKQQEEIMLSRELNREEKSLSFEFYYRILSESFFFLNVGYNEYNFDYRESKWRNSHSYQVYSGIRFPFQGKLRGTLSLGYKKMIPEVGTKQGFSGPVGNTSIDLRLGRFNLRSRFNRDCRFSYWTNNIYFLENRLGSGISFYFTQSLRLDYDYTYGKASYPEIIIIQTPEDNYKEIKRRDVYQTQRAGFALRVIRNIGIGVSLEYWRWNSNLYSEKRNWMFIGGYLTYEF